MNATSGWVCFGAVEESGRGHMEVISEEFGHCGTFFTKNACAADAALVKWGQREVSVPSNGILNVPARVCLRSVSTTILAAKAWCARVGANFVAFDKSLLFEVHGFSRYRYVDSDEEKNDVNLELRVSDVDSPRRGHRLRVNSPDNSGTRAGSTSPSQLCEIVGAQEPSAIVRRRLLNGRVIVFDDEEDEDVHPSAAVEITDAAGVLVKNRPDAPWAVRQRIIPCFRSILFSNFTRSGDAGDEDTVFRDGDEIMLDITPGKHSERQVRFHSETKLNALCPSNTETMDADVRLKSGLLLNAPSSKPFALPVKGISFMYKRNSVLGTGERFAGIGQARKRAFRVGFNGVRSVLKPGYSPVFNTHSSGGFVISVEPVFVRKIGPRERSQFVSVLNIHCTAWKLEELNPTVSEYKSGKSDCKQESGDGGRRSIRVPRLDYSFRIPEIVNGVLEDVASAIKVFAAERTHLVHGCVLFGLLRALYTRNVTFETKGIENLITRVVDWGLILAESSFDCMISEQATLRRALVLLTTGDVTGAVDSALNSGHVQLAMLISRALEVQKDDVREDTLTQLTSCFVSKRSAEDELVWGDMDDRACYAAFLDDCGSTEAVSVDERMVLLLLSGRIPPVAHHLKLSWYRVFLMELLYGAGSQLVSHPARLSSAVAKIESSGMSTSAPHGEQNDVDVVHHLLRLFADQTSYPVSVGLYSSRSIGHILSPLDGQLPWLLHQILSALVPVATTPHASLLLAGAFCAQLQASGLPLWGFYVLCSGSAPESLLKKTLIRSWPDLCEDLSAWNGIDDSFVKHNKHDSEFRMMESTVEKFLVSMLQVPIEWIYEAKATWLPVSGDLFNKCSTLTVAKSEDGLIQAHHVLTRQLFPVALGRFDVDELEVVRDLLDALASHVNVSKWSSQGGLILQYLKHVADIPGTHSVGMETLGLMVREVTGFSADAKTYLSKYAVTSIASSISSALRAGLVSTPRGRGALRDHLMPAIALLPASMGTKKRICGELRVEVEMGEALANRYAVASSFYRKYLADSSYV